MEITKKVLITATNFSQLCKEAKVLLENNGVEIIENKKGRPLEFDEIKEIITDIDGVIAGVDSWDESVFSIAPKLKVISRFGVGVDNIDLKKAAEYGIKVTNAPRVNSNAVAELAVGHIINCLRNIVNLTNSTVQGQWERFVGYELKGKKVGLLGFGNIAQSVSKKLQGFDVEMYAYDKYPNYEIAKQYNLEFLSAEKILSECDIISMHLPSIEETKYFMNDKTFGMLKEGACFINTSRGMLVDESALYRALKTGNLAAAAIDVYNEEPVSKDNPLFELSNIITTPHTAAETYEVYHSVGLLTAEAVISVFEGKSPENLLT